MPIEIRPGVTIRRPWREVGLVLFDTAREAEWSMTFRPSADIGPDAVMRSRRVRFLLRRRAVELRVKATDGERFIEFEADTPFPLYVRHDMESIPEGTLTRVRLRLRLTGLGRLFMGFVRWRLRRALIRDLERLKMIVENSPIRGIASALPPSGESLAIEAEPTAAPEPAFVTPEELAPIRRPPREPEAPSMPVPAPTPGVLIEPPPSRPLSGAETRPPARGPAPPVPTPPKFRRPAAAPAPQPAGTPPRRRTPDW